LRGYAYSGEQLVAIQSGGNYFVHQDPVTKSQRITDASGNVVEAIELDPFGGETNRSTNQIHSESSLHQLGKGLDG
jgi:hypothetical protein